MAPSRPTGTQNNAMSKQRNMCLIPSPNNNKPQRNSPDIVNLWPTEPRGTRVDWWKITKWPV